MTKLNLDKTLIYGFQILVWNFLSKYVLFILVLDDHKNWENKEMLSIDQSHNSVFVEANDLKEIEKIFITKKY